MRDAARRETVRHTTCSRAHHGAALGANLLLRGGSGGWEILGAHLGAPRPRPLWQCEGLGVADASRVAWVRWATPPPGCNFINVVLNGKPSFLRVTTQPNALAVICLRLLSNSQRVLTLPFDPWIGPQMAAKSPSRPILRTVKQLLLSLRPHFGTSMSFRTRRLLLLVAMLLAAALCCCPVASRALLEGDQNPVETNNETTGQYYAAWPPAASPIADQHSHSGASAVVCAHPRAARPLTHHPTQPKLGPQTGTTASPITPAPGESDTSTAVAGPTGPPLLLVPLSLAPANEQPDAAVLSRAAHSFIPSIDADDTSDGAHFDASRADVGRAKMSRIIGGVPLSFVEAACTQKPTTIGLDAASANTLKMHSVATNAEAGNAGATALLVGGVGWGG